MTKEERAEQQAEILKQQAKAAALQQQLADLEKSNQMASADRERLAGQLQFTEAQKQAATAQLAQAQEDLNLQRQENSKLAEGVQALAGKSSELAREIQSNRALAPNTIFDEFSSNRVSIDFAGTRPGFFGGQTSKDKQTQTIVATDGNNSFAVCHLQDTLLTLWDPMQWSQLTGTIARGPFVFPIDSLSVYLYDPRSRSCLCRRSKPRNWGARSITCRAILTDSRTRSWWARATDITASASSRLICQRRSI